MCTIVAALGLFESWPLVVLGNRDELYARTSRPPRVLSDEPRAVGGLDVETGGTWLGANELGVFAALTNQRTWARPAPRPRSRGLVVRGALGVASADEQEAYLRAEDPRTTLGWNLLFGSADDVRLAYSRPEEGTLEVARLAGSAVHVLSNDRVGSPDFPKAALAETRMRELAARRASPRDIARALADHTLFDVATPPESQFDAALVRALSALCIHTPHYGTVSASALFFGRSGRVERYLYLDGPPCRAIPEDRPVP